MIWDLTTTIKLTTIWSALGPDILSITVPTSNSNSEECLRSSTRHWIIVQINNVCASTLRSKTRHRVAKCTNTYSINVRMNAFVLRAVCVLCWCVLLCTLYYSTTNGIHSICVMLGFCWFSDRCRCRKCTEHARELVFRRTDYHITHTHTHTVGHSTYTNSARPPQSQPHRPPSVPPIYQPVPTPDRVYHSA